MSTVVIFSARHVMLTMGLIVTFLGNASASPNTVTVQDPRPVANAIQELEKRYGWLITYVAPPYSHNSAITDVTYTSWPGVPAQSPSQLQAAQREHRRLGPK